MALATSETYADVAYADAYFAGRPHVQLWNDVSTTTENKEESLRMARIHLDGMYVWLGHITEASQPMSWPRIGVIDHEGREIASDVPPEAVKKAQCELAMQWLGADQLTPLATYLTSADPKSANQIKREKLEGLEREYFQNMDYLWRTNAARMEKIYPIIDSLLRGLYESRPSSIFRPIEMV